MNENELNCTDVQRWQRAESYKLQTDKPTVDCLETAWEIIFQQVITSCLAILIRITAWISFKSTTETNRIEFLHNFFINIDSPSWDFLVAFYIDFKKAFAKVDHGRLIEKLSYWESEEHVWSCWLATSKTGSKRLSQLSRLYWALTAEFHRDQFLVPCFSWFLSMTIPTAPCQTILITLMISRELEPFQWQ